MKTVINAPLLKDVLTVRNRYVRAVNIGRDREDAHALDGYLLTDTVRQALTRLVQGLQAHSTQRAWRITGSYGSGKSAFGLFVTHLFTHGTGKRSIAGRIVDEMAPDLVPALKRLPKYDVIVITGTRADASVSLAHALIDFLSQRRSGPTQKQLLGQLRGFIRARAQRKVAPADVIDLLAQVRAHVSTGVSASEGLLLLVDEMGRWLEYAADADNDIDASFFQALAETCGGRARDIPMAMVGILHQRFEDYVGGRRDRRSGLEWAKVAERFEDVTFVQSADSTARLVARALESDAAAFKAAGIYQRVAAITAQAAKLGITPSESQAGTSLGAYPIHSVALHTAITLFRRFGQNERSAFSFLLASEPFAFQDFIGRHRLGPNTWYRVHDLCDWLLAQGSLRTHDDERLKRWSLLQDVLRAAPVYDELEAKCLKTVGLLSLLEPQPGMVITRELVAFALTDDAASKDVAATLAKLVQKCLLYVRPATQEYCLWPQSSVDVASELSRIRKSTPPLTRLGALIKHLPLPRPIVAHRHYVDTGTLRTALVRMVDDINDIASHVSESLAADGEIVIVPCYPDQDHRSIARKLQELSAAAQTGRLLALRRIGDDELEIADELVAWRQLETSCVELRVDAYARTEVRQAIHRLTEQLINQLADLRAPGHGGQETSWWHAGVRLPIQSGRDLNQTLSSIFAERYGSTPKVRNELINRASVSTAAAAARQRLLERMFTHAAVEGLGIELTPPEKAIYLSVLKESGLHAQTANGWAFTRPSPDSGWEPAWSDLHQLLERDGLMNVRRMLDHFAAPPFGMRESVSLLLLGAFLNVHRHDLILRERGTYVTQLEGSHISRLVKRPESFELHMVHAQATMVSALDVYQTVLQSHFPGTAISNTVAELTRQLYDWYLSLPEYTLNTTTLDSSHRSALALLGKASDPVELLTVSLPLALGVNKAAKPLDASSKLNLELLRARLSGLLKAGSDKLNVLRGQITKVIAEEVGVRDPHGARAHIVALAKNANDDVVDYALKAFIQRTMDGSRDQRKWIDSVASLLGGRSIESWHDDTIVRFRAELRRAYTLLTRVVTLAKLTGAREGADHTMVAVHVVDQRGQERFVAVPADSQGLLPAEDLGELRAALNRLPVPAYALARLLLEYSVELPMAKSEEVA